MLPRSTSNFSRRLHRGPGSPIKHRISKREYKVVLSKTYIRTTLLMLKYQGKGGGVHHAEVPALTWLVLNYEYQTRGKKRTRVHYISNQYTTMVTSSTSPRGAHHSTHAYLCKFYKYPIKIVY